MKDEELLLCIALSMQPGLGPVTTRSLVAYCGSVEGVYRQRKEALLKIPGIGPQTASALLRHNLFARAEEELAFARKHAIRILFYTDAGYPRRLQHCNDAPVVLYYKGSHDLNAARMLAVVGTRAATDYGKQFTETLVAELKPYEVAVISGLAYGIDICAHRAAIREQVPTIGVVAHGLDRIYPSLHKRFADRMTENGGLLTEYPAMTNPDAENFPSRNRIVAGCSDAVIVVEAAEKGGALITADIANSYNRDVFAVPGRAGDSFSVGCNQLIRSNRAGLITSALDVVTAMGWERKEENLLPTALQRELFVALDVEETKICEVLKGGKVHGDTLGWQSGLPASKVNAVLLRLELRGIVKVLPGRMYQLV